MAEQIPMHGFALIFSRLHGIKKKELLEPITEILDEYLSSSDLAIKTKEDFGNDMDIILNDISELATASIITFGRHDEDVIRGIVISFITHVMHFVEIYQKDQENL